MPNKPYIFISYRREDSADFAGRLYDNLSREYQVFFDTEEGIPTGEKFANIITREIEQSDIFLLIIGSKSAEGFQRREGQTDYVLKEILHAEQSSCTIMPILVNGVAEIGYLPREIEFVQESQCYAFAHTKFSLNLLGLKQEIAQYHHRETEMDHSTFVQEVAEGLDRERLVVLLSQDFTNIDRIYQHIKAQMQSQFDTAFYLVSVPSYVDDQEEYFSCIARDCKLSCEIRRENDWYRAIQDKLQSSSQALLLFVTDLENGNEELDRKFATMLRNLKERFPHFHALFVGKKALARLVYGESELSPLNTAREIFFPDDGTPLDEQKIVQQFSRLRPDQAELCQLLQKEQVSRFTTWHYNPTINNLFWKNLLVREGTQLVWRGELTKEIARDILGCEE